MNPIVDLRHVLIALVILVILFACFTLSQPYLMDAAAVDSWRLKVLLPIGILAYALLRWRARPGRDSERRESTTTAAFFGIVLLLVCTDLILPYINATIGRQTSLPLRGVIVRTWPTRRGARAIVYDSLSNRQFKLEITRDERHRLLPGNRFYDRALRGSLGVVYRPRYDLPWVTP